MVTPRIVCQFSCGTASAVATKLALAQYGGTHDVQIINAFLVEEDTDNRRFLADCESWFGRKITVLRDEKYGASAINVFRTRRYIKGPNGAPCSQILKRKLLDAWKRPGDVMVMGYTIEEIERFADFKAENPDRAILAPLIDHELTKTDVMEMVQRAGIMLPLMSRMGYDHDNCKACPKGGEGYHRAIRIDFPEHHYALCDVEEEIGPSSYIFRDRKTGERRPLRELSWDGPVTRGGDLPSCSFYCQAAERKLIPLDVIE